MRIGDSSWKAAPRLRDGSASARSRAKRSFLEIVDYRVGDRSFGDDADDVAGPRPTIAAEDDGGSSASAFQPREHEAENIDVPADDDAVFDKSIDRNLLIPDRLHP